jgi:uncharacterized membrane protein
MLILNVQKITGMTEKRKKSRIIFIDLMRAFAVLQMVQGHTIDALLSNEYRSFQSPIFVVWYFMRGMTAPIFLFTAGTVFTYLLRTNSETFFENPRVKKGIKRFLLLVFLGYLLRFPTPSPFNFSHVSSDQWNIFFAVDVLQSIGFGILFIMVFALISEKTKISDYIVFAVAACIIFGLFPVFEKINWASFLPVPIAGYFYSGTGSIFPLFPWAGYVVGGAVLGSYLAKHPLVFKTKKFSLMVLIFGVSFISAAMLLNIFGNDFFHGAWIGQIYTILLRVGFVLILNSLVSFICLEVETIPHILILIGRNTLLIYVVHLVIIYGSAWNPGLYSYLAKSFNAWSAVGVAMLMILAMTAIVIAINKLKIKNKQLVT